MPRLAVNVDHVATVREARKTNEPDPVAAAICVEQAGAHGLVVHLRQDRRHIQERDVELILRLIRLPVNLEMAGTTAMVQIAKNLKPFSVTLVPENPAEVTTQGGLDLTGKEKHLQSVIRSIKESVPEVSLFIDPVPGMIQIAGKVGADAVEFHTGEYADSRDPKKRDSELLHLSEAAKIAYDLGLTVRMGHGLTYLNVEPVADIPHVSELSIGHSIISRSIFTGLHQAVTDMLLLIER